MDKIKIGSTYGYDNFITIDEQAQLIYWVNQNYHKFKDNGPGRKFGIISQIQKSSFDLITHLREKIVSLESIRDFKPEPMFGDYVGVNTSGGAIHVHKDPNLDPYVHTRYNIILSYPEQGGESIYGSDVNSLHERLVWKCVAGKVPHGSTPVIGAKPRITLSLGFLIND